MVAGVLGLRRIRAAMVAGVVSPAEPIGVAHWPDGHDPWPIGQG